MDDSSKDAEKTFYSCLYTKHKTQKRKKWQDGKAEINFEQLSARIYSLEGGKFICKVKAGSDFFAAGRFVDTIVETEAFLVDLSEATPLSAGDENNKPSFVQSNFLAPTNFCGGQFKRRTKKKFHSSLHGPSPDASAYPSQPIELPRKIHRRGENGPHVQDYGSFKSHSHPTTVNEGSRASTTSKSESRYYNGNDQLVTSRCGRSGQDIVNLILNLQKASNPAPSKVGVNANPCQRSKPFQVGGFQIPQLPSARTTLPSSVPSKTDESQSCGLIFPLTSEACKTLWSNVEAAEVRSGSTGLENGFQDVGDYRSCFLKCLNQQLQIGVWEVARKFHSHTQSFAQQKPTFSSKSTGSPRRALEQYLRRKGVALHTECEVIRGRDPSRHGRQKGKWRGSRSHSVSEVDDTGGQDTQKFYLKFKNSKTLQHSSQYALGDLWVLQPTGTKPTFVSSQWHGISAQSSMMEISFLCSADQRRYSRRQSTAVDAIRMFNCSLELDIKQLFEQLPQKVAIGSSGRVSSGLGVSASMLNSVVFGPQTMDDTVAPQHSVKRGFIEEVRAQAIELCAHHSLNSYQRQCILHAANWFLPSRHRFGPVSDDDQVSETSNTVGHETRMVELVHGVFGAGKSFVLSLVLQLFCSIVSQFKMKTRILLAAATNNAVDGVLRYMLQRDVKGFVRIGSKPAVHADILPHFSNGDIDLQPDKCIVATTISSCSTATALEGHNSSFDIVVLDECSQMVEPASMLPVLKFGCKRLMLVGDPNQLPPIIRQTPLLKQRPNTKGYENAIFVRLLSLGYTSTMLSLQYRCHPAIANVCNELFYESKLGNGIKENDRPRLAPSLAPLVFLNCHHGSTEQLRGFSAYNTQEVELVVRVCRSLLRSGLGPERIGIISPYRGQVKYIQDRFKRSFDASVTDGVHIGTVDAFQGGERDVIVVSTVCTGTRPGTHDSNPERLNVTISRARHHLIIVGCAQTLRRGKLWNAILKHCSQEDIHDLVEAITNRTTLSGKRSIGHSDEKAEVCKPRPAVASQKKTESTVTKQLSASRDLSANDDEMRKESIVASATSHGDADACPSQLVSDVSSDSDDDDDDDDNANVDDHMIVPKPPGVQTDTPTSQGVETLEFSDDE